MNALVLLDSRKYSKLFISTLFQANSSGAILAHSLEVFGGK